MLVPRVSVKSHRTEEEFKMDNIQTNPVYRYHRGVNLPANATPNNITYTYELLLNGKSANLFADVVVLSEQALLAIITDINDLEPHVTWEQFGKPGNYEPLTISNATIPLIIDKIVMLENATMWFTYDDPNHEPEYEDDLQTILMRIEAVKQAVEWGVLA